MRFLVPTLVTVAWLILATAGCQSTPPVVEQPREEVPAEPVAKPGPREADAEARASLDEAERLANEGDWVGATALFSIVPREQLSAADRLRHGLLGVRLAVRSGDVEEARRLAATLDLSSRVDPIDRLLAEAWLAALHGRPALAAGRLMRSTLPESSTDAARQRVNDTIWELVSLTPALETLALADRGTDTERAWWSLRLDLLRSPTLGDNPARVAAWQAAHPEHPGARQLPTVLRAPAATTRQPRQVALLLPVSGPLARAGRAVRDGFMTAWFAQPEEQRFAVRVYDTGRNSLAEIVPRALADGAEVIVGPLQREAVSALNDLAPDVPVLALNYLAAGTPTPQLAQFGLAIEDDVGSLVHWLRDTGAERIMVLHGPHEWAARVERALADQGMAPVASHLLPEMRTVTDEIGSALHIQDSIDRHAEVQRLMGLSVAFTPRSRTDIDAVVALVNAVEVTALVPALRYHYADDIPAYATAQTLLGANNTTLRAMDGYGVVELPWQLPEEPGRALIEAAFPLGRDPFASMYALGADALRLVDRVLPANRSAAAQVLGNTGVLTVGPDGKVQRELARMRVARGALVQADAP